MEKRGERAALTLYDTGGFFCVVVVVLFVCLFLARGSRFGRAPLREVVDQLTYDASRNPS